VPASSASRVCVNPASARARRSSPAPTPWFEVLVSLIVDSVSGSIPILHNVLIESHHPLVRAHSDAHPMDELLMQDATTRARRRTERRSEPLCRGLVRHHMTPMAGRVADGEENQHVALARLGERLLSPTPASPPGRRHADAGRARSRRRAPHRDRRDATARSGPRSRPRRPAETGTPHRTHHR